MIYNGTLPYKEVNQVTRIELILHKDSLSILLLKDLSRTPHVFIDLRLVTKNNTSKLIFFYYVLFEWFIKEDPPNSGTLIQNSVPYRKIYKFSNHTTENEAKEYLASIYKNTEIYFEINPVYDTFDSNSFRKFKYKSLKDYPFMEKGGINWNVPRRDDWNISIPAFKPKLF